MRKIFFTLLCLCIFNTNAIAASVTSCTRDEEGNCSEGCEPNEQGTSCLLCKNGYYKSGNNKNRCTQCSHPAGTKGEDWEWADESTGHTSDSCPWTAYCGTGEYWQSNNATRGCYACSGGYESKEGNAEFTVWGRGNSTVVTISPSGNAEDFGIDDRCEAQVFTLELKKNTLLTDLYWPFERARYEDKTAYAKYNTGFAKSADSTSWSEKTLPDDLLQPDRPYKLFQGYSDNKDCEKGNLYFNADGVFQLDWSKLTSDKTLYACWDNVTVKVNYYNAAGTVYKTQSCTVDDTSTTFDCTAWDYTGGITDEYAGQIFNYYSCTYGDGTPCNPSTVKEGDSIPLGNATINLRPVFQQCSPGYWCDNNQTNPCPAGTTSAGGAASEENCYMVRGNNGTRFCDSNGCFFLPGLGNISFNPDDP